MPPVDVKLVVKEMHRLGLKRWLLIALTEAFETARKGKLKSFDEHSFDVNWMQNLVRLRDAVLAWRYETGKSVAFVVFDPMVREIFAAPFKDRVIHHFLYALQAPWWDAHFIYDSYSCRVGKGTLMGIHRVKRMMQQATDNFTHDAIVFKMDISGCFMSFPRRGLLERVEWGLERQFAEVRDDPMGRQLYYICKYLWGKVLLDDPAEKAWRRGPRWHWHPQVLPERKSLFCQAKGYGLPIGNVTSQLASNIYLDQLDRYVKYELGYDYYGRYVDDFVRIVPADEKGKLLADVGKIERFLKEEMELKLHPDKKYCQSVWKGVSFVGARIYPRAIYPSDRMQARFKAALRDLVGGRGSLESLQSYLGLMEHLQAEDYVDEVMERYGQIVGEHGIKCGETLRQAPQVKRAGELDRNWLADHTADREAV